MRTVVVATAGVLLLLPGTAGAQELSASLAFSPDRAGVPAGLTSSFTVRDPQRPPDGLAVFTPAGLRLDPRAVRVRCADAAAQRGECPRASRVGNGQVRARTLLGTFTARGAAHLGVARPGEHAVLWLRLEGFSDTLRAVIRRSGDRYVIRMDGLGGGRQVPPGAVSEVSGEMRLEARRRTVTRRKRMRGRTRRVRTTYHLLRTPRTCPGGGWTARVELTTGGRTDTVPVTAACS